MKGIKGFVLWYLFLLSFFLFGKVFIDKNVTECRMERKPSFFKFVISCLIDSYRQGCKRCPFAV